MLAVNQPPEGGTYNTTQIEMRGRAKDLHSGLSRLYYVVNGELTHDLPVEDPWSATVILPEGDLVIEFVAVDLVGNEARETRNIVVDTVAPTLLSIDPPDGNVTRSFSLLLSGRTEPGVTLEVEGEELEVGEDGSFSGFVTLGNEEGEQVLELVLTDLAGNTARIDHTVVVDRTPPDLLVNTNPDFRDFPFINTSRITVFGTTEPGARVVVFLDTGPTNETIADDEGKWLLDIELELGENYFTIDAWDAAGNRQSNDIVDFLYDVTPPIITLLQPQNGTVTKLEAIIVEMRTEPEATVWVNNEQALVMPLHGELEFDVPLIEVGGNEITVYARDQAGNLATMKVTVIREKKGGDDGDDGTGAGPWVAIAVVVVIAVVAAAAYTVRRRSD